MISDDFKKQAIDESVYLLFKQHDYDECLELAFKQYLDNPNDKFYLFFIVETSLFLVRAYTTKSRYSKAEKIAEDGLKWAILCKNRVWEASFYQELGNLNKSWWLLLGFLFFWNE